MFTLCLHISVGAFTGGALGAVLGTYASSPMLAVSCLWVGIALGTLSGVFFTMKGKGRT